MLQLIKKIFNPSQVRRNKQKEKTEKGKSVYAKSFDGAKQLREMGKLGGKLILM